MRKMLAVVLIVVAGVFMLSAPNVMAQLPCTADFNCDQNVDAGDVDTFLSQFGRNPFNDPCPDCYDSQCPCTAPGCDPPAPIPKTGQATVYGSRDDGYWQQALGVQWPNPRFTDNRDGTVTDNLTGLIWLEDANCFGYRTWNEALSDCNGLYAGYCGLTDGSSAGEWRLPNRRELFSLIHDGYYEFALPNTVGTGKWSEGNPFLGVQDQYWSSTTDPYETSYARAVGMAYGSMSTRPKNDSLLVWPVRGGQ